jgi:hypothetical protein
MSSKVFAFIDDSGSTLNYKRYKQYISSNVKLDKNQTIITWNHNIV